MSPEHQNTADDLARELAGIKHIDNRLERVEDENLDARELVSTLSQSISSIEATLVIFGAQLKTLVNKPSRLGSIIAAFSVGITIFALALTPVAWLAINNSARHDEDVARELQIAEERGALRAQAQGLEALLDQSVQAHMFEALLNTFIQAQMAEDQRQETARRGLEDWEMERDK